MHISSPNHRRAIPIYLQSTCSSVQWRRTLCGRIDGEKERGTTQESCYREPDGGEVTIVAGCFLSLVYFFSLVIQNDINEIREVLHPMMPIILGREQHEVASKTFIFRSYPLNSLLKGADCWAKWVGDKTRARQIGCEWERIKMVQLKVGTSTNDSYSQCM